MTEPSNQEKAALFERFRELMRSVCTAIEDLAIENTVYALAIADEELVSPVELKERVATALLDPDARAAARQAYSGLWKAFEGVGEQAYFEALLRDLPKTEKPN
jgi:hypothetical protein